MNAPFPNPPPPSTRQPVLNLPPVVGVLIGVLVAIHAFRIYGLGAEADIQVILNFAFIPIREVQPEAFAGMAQAGAWVWTFLTYAFLHGDWMHVAINCVWLAAFGSPLARRFGAVRFLAFSAVGAVAGAALHLAIYPHSLVPMVGASAAISAQMAGAARFVFQTGGPMWGRSALDAHRRPAAPLTEIVRDRRVLAFLGVWFGINIVFGLTGGAGLAAGGIAWDAHIGGFIAGLLLFRVFDPVPAAR
jgi:membrane associated rhomboid family serine protease